MAIVAMTQSHFQELHLHLKTDRVDDSVNSVSPPSQLVHVLGFFCILFFFLFQLLPPNRALPDGYDCKQYLISFNQTCGWQAFHLMGLTLIREAFSFLLRGIFLYSPSVIRDNLCQQLTPATWLPALISKP